MIDVQFNPSYLNRGIIIRDTSYNVDKILGKFGDDAIFQYNETRSGHELYYQGERVQHGSTTKLLSDGVLVPFVGNWITVEKRKLP